MVATAVRRKPTLLPGLSWQLPTVPEWRLLPLLCSDKMEVPRVCSSWLLLRSGQVIPGQVPLPLVPPCPWPEALGSAFSPGHRGWNQAP